MSRSTGITVTAVLAFVGSAFALLPAVGAALIAVFSHASKASHALPRPFLWVAIVVYLGIGTWAIATGVGLLKLREWSRISQLIFSSMLVLAGVGAAMLMPFINLPVPPNDADPEVTRQFLSSMKIGLAGFYGVLAALGAWWLYYFNRASVRAQFRNSRFQAAVLGTEFPVTHLHPATTAASSVPSGGPPNALIVPPPGNPSTRPVSISVVAVLLLFGAAVLPVHLILRTPLLLFGFMLSGWPAVLLAMTICSAGAAAGIGLFRLKLWARTLAICLAVFTLLNLLLTVFMPGSQSRWDQAMQAIYEKWGIPSTMPLPHFPLWVTMLPGMPVVLVELYFLITRKSAFVAASKNAFSDPAADPPIASAR